MKKLLSILIVCVLALSCLAGCAGTEENASSSESSAVSASNSQQSSTEQSSSSIKNQMTLKKLWDTLEGYWIYNDAQFVFFSFNESDEPVFKQGLLQSGGGRSPGTIDGMEAISETEYKITVHYPAQPENMLDGPYDELIEDIYIDLSSLADNKISVKFPGESYQEYVFTGSQPVFAMDAATLWQVILGYWTNADNNFVCFLLDQAAAPVFNTGGWQSELGRNNATIDNVEVLSDYEYRITVHYPAQAENMLNGPYDELIADIYLDLKDYQNNIIYVKLPAGDYTKYEFTKAPE